MQISETSMTFNYVAETQQLLITYKLFEVRNLEVLLFNYPFGYTADYEIFEDGYQGRMLINITSKENTNPDEYFSGKIEISLHGDDDFWKFYTIPINQYCMNSRNKFVKTSASLCVLPWWVSDTHIHYELVGGAVIKEVRGSVDWLNPIDHGNGDVQMVAWSDNNFWTEMREGDVEFVHDSGVIDKVHIVQFNYSEFPISRDIFARYNTEEDFVEYKIYGLGWLGPDLEKPLYSGRSYKLPGTKFAEININKLCENFLDERIDTAKIENDLPDYGKPFFLEINNEIKVGYVFYNSWTYDEGMVLSKGPNVLPITYLSNYMQYQDDLFITVWNNSLLQTEAPFMPLQYADGDMNWKTDESVKVDLQPFETKVIKVDLNSIPEAFDSLKFGSNYLDFCGAYKENYGLLFRNKTGAYSFVKVNGAINKKNEVKGYETDSSFDNTKAEWERSKYMNELSTIYEVNLNFLSRGKADDIDNLLESTEVYLKFSEEIEYIPVIIESVETDFKMNEKVRNYKIKLRASQSRIRR